MHSLMFKNFWNTLSTFEKISQDRDVAQAGNFVPNIGDAIVDQSGDDEALSIFQLEFGLSLART